jgi:leader peptidase (prepilin peptidase)/N-methyltransferase
MGMATAEISLLCFGGWNGYWHEINLCVVTVFSLLTLLLIIAQIDQQTMEIPNGLVIACIVPAAMAVFAFPDVTLTERLIGFFSVSLPLFAITLAVPGAFGGGDIKLMAVIGFFLGWKMSLTAFMLAVFSGGIYGIGLLLSKKKGAKEHFAFGPFLCAGTALTLFVGEWLLSWYLSIIF